MIDYTHIFAILIETNHPEGLVSVPLLTVASILAVVYGTNAGGTILSTGISVRAFRPIVGLAMLGLAIATVPIVLGTSVASTLATQMVAMDSKLGQIALLEAVVASLVITTFLSWLGIPTSLTLALVGGIAGVGAGAGLEVSWARICLVVGGVAVAPLLGAVIANILSRNSRRWNAASTARRQLKRTHIAAFVAMIAAFGSNDAQKLLAVVAVAMGTAGTLVPTSWWQLAGIAVLFCCGTAIGMRRMSGATNSGVLRLQPLDAVVAESATASVMLVSSAFGNPVGISQTLTGSFVGAGLSRGRGRIRWDYAGRIVNAWFATLPAAFAIAWTCGVITARVLAE